MVLIEKMYMELYKSARQVCEACCVKAGEKVVIYSDTMKNPPLIDAFFNAAVICGAEAVVVKAESRAPLLEPPKTALEAMLAADIVFDLATETWLYTNATNAIIASGVRMLQVLVSDASIIARPPTASIRERVAAADNLYKNCTEVKITSANGTDFTMRRGDRPTIPQDGCVNSPGTWDSLGLAKVSIFPPETESEGVIVFDGSLYLIPDHKLILEKPIRATVEKGRIVNIEADHKEAKLLDTWLRSWNDPSAYVIAHVGFGLDARANIYSYDIGAWESYNGGILIGIGSNISIGSQGKNKCLSHMDACFFDSDFYVDGRPVIKEGKFVVPELM